MQFNLKGAVKDTRIPKAYIDSEGDLVIFDTTSSDQHVCLTSEGMVVYYNSDDAKKELESALRPLYEGDTVSITF